MTTATSFCGDEGGSLDPPILFLQVVERGLGGAGGKPSDKGGRSGAAGGSRAPGGH